MANYYDGEWRPITDLSHKSLDRLRGLGFELGSDRYGRLMARWPVAPAAPLTSCRGCSVEFEDINGHALCDECLVDRVNGAGELELDDPDDVINRPLPLTGIPLAYWREEVAQGCSTSLQRLFVICRERGADYDMTVAGLEQD